LNEPTTDEPTKARKKSTKKKRAVSSTHVSRTDILNGLEEDIIDYEDENKDANSNRELLAAPASGSLVKDDDMMSANYAGNFTSIVKSVPTDKFYLELNKKFAAQNKNIFEKHEQERARMIAQARLKQKQREQLKYQISTPRTALYTHAFLRVIFLFLQGINSGIQILNAVFIYLIESSKFNIIATVDPAYLAVNSFKFFVLIESLTMPVHCVSYFLLVVCMVDAMDRVDFAKMTVSHFIKCISFQNQFWAIFLYLIALVFSLATINIDEAVYLNLYLNSLNYSSNNTNIDYINVLNTVRYFKLD
jgi:hypothetical protein